MKDVKGRVWMEETAEQGTPLPDDTLLTAKEAQALLGVKANTLKQWVHRGHLQPSMRGSRRYLFQLSDLERCMDERSARRVAVGIASV